MAAKLKIEKMEMKFKEKSSPLKLQSQSQPNFADMILGYVKKLIIMLIQFKFGHFLA
jgi:hypothetical protein